MITVQRKYNVEYRFLFLFFIHHDNQVGLLFPDHLPEVVRGLVQGMLGGDVTRLAFVILLIQESMESFIHYLTNKEAQAVYYTVIKHVENQSRRRVFSTFLECSQMSGVFYHSVIHELGFFICFMI